MAEIVEWVASVEGVAAARRALGRRFRVGRVGAGLSQAEAAGVAGVSQSAYSRVELGGVALGLGAARCLAGRYGCGVSELLPREMMLSAPLDPVERLVWVRERNERVRSGAGSSRV